MGLQFSSPKHESHGRRFINDHARMKANFGENYDLPYEWHGNTCTIHHIGQLFPKYQLQHKDPHSERAIYDEMVKVDNILMELIRERNREESDAFIKAQAKNPGGGEQIWPLRHPQARHHLTNTTFDCDDESYARYNELVQDYWVQRMLPHFHILEKDHVHPSHIHTTDPDIAHPYHEFFHTHTHERNPYNGE